MLISGTAGTGKSTLAAQFCDADVPPRRAGDVLRLRGVRGGDRAQHGLGRHRPAAVGGRGAAAVPLLRARACSASRRTCSPCRSSSASSTPPWSSWTRSPTSCASATGADVSAMLTRQVDFLKARGVTALFTSLELRGECRRRPTSRSRRSSTRGCSSRRWRATASTTASSTCSSRAAWPTRTRSASSSSPTRASSWPTSTSARRACSPAPPARPRRRRSAPTARRGWRTSSSAGSTSRRRRESVEAQTAALWREFEDEADVVERLLQPRLDRAPRTAPGSGPSRAGSAAPTPTSPRTSARERRCAMTRHRLRTTRRRRGQGDLAPAAVRRGPVAEVAAGVRQPQGRCARSTSPGATRSRSSTSSSSRRWRAATTSSPSRHWCAACPRPLRKIIGDLSDTERVLVGLRLAAGAGAMTAARAEDAAAATS